MVNFYLNDFISQVPKTNRFCIVKCDIKYYKNKPYLQLLHFTEIKLRYNFF